MRFVCNSQLRHLCLVVSVFSLICVPAVSQTPYDVADELGLIPTPREIQLDGNVFSLSGWEIVVPADAPLTQAGAEEINQRIMELGGVTLPVVQTPTPGTPAILAGRWWDPFIHAAATALNTSLTPENPGRQGYVIRCGTYEGRRVILLGGSDDQGVLYACVTMRHLMMRQGAEAVARSASVRDWPDFKIRNNGSLDIALLSRTGATPANPGPLYNAAAVLKTQVDYFLRHKVNWVTSSSLRQGDRMDAELYLLVRQLADGILQYARSRGIRIRTGGGAEIGKYLTPDLIKDAVVRDPGTSYMWSAIDAHRANAWHYADYLRNSQPGMFMFHPIDSGGFLDPEKWSVRSPQCVARYGDNRTLAEFEQFMIYFDAVRDVCPDVMLEAVSLPYHFQWAIDEFPQVYQEQDKGMPHGGWLGGIKDPAHAREVQRMNREHHRALGRMLDPDVFITFREADQKIFLAAAELYPQHPLTVWIYPDRNNGWLGTFCPQVRMAKTFWFPERNDYYYVASSWTGYGDGRVQRMAQQEYLWNVDRPDGSTEFSAFARFYEKGGRTVTDFQKHHLIPRISKVLYGDAADAFQTLTEANVSVHYVADPKNTAQVTSDCERLANVYTYMGEQAEAFERLHPSFAALADNLGTGRYDETTEAWILHWYKYTGIAALKARLETVASHCRDLKAAGKASDAQTQARQALSGLPAMQRQCEALHARALKLEAKVTQPAVFTPPRMNEGFEALNKFRPNDFESELKGI